MRRCEQNRVGMRTFRILLFLYFIFFNKPFVLKAIEESGIDRIFVKIPAPFCMLGNSWTVDIIAHILKNIYKLKYRFKVVFSLKTVFFVFCVSGDILSEKRLSDV